MSLLDQIYKRYGKKNYKAEQRSIDLYLKGKLVKLITPKPRGRKNPHRSQFTRLRRTEARRLKYRDQRNALLPETLPFGCFGNKL